MEAIARRKLPEFDGGGMFCDYEGVCECLGMGLEIGCVSGGLLRCRGGDDRSCIYLTMSLGISYSQNGF